MDTSGEQGGGGIPASQALLLVWLTFFANPRTFTQVLISFFAIRISTLAAAGHLASMRNLGVQSQTVRVIGFAVLPTLPIANLIYRGVLVLFVSTAQPHPLTAGPTQSRTGSILPYYISAVLGVRAIPESALADAGASSFVDLLEQDHHVLVRTSEPRNLRWVCRLLILCALLAQSLAAVAVWSRRTFTSLVNDVELQYMMNMGWPTKHKSAAYDVFNGAYAIGGAVTILHSLVLGICNWRWQYSNSPGSSNQSDRRSHEYGAESHRNFGRELQLATILFILITAEFWKRYLEMHVRGQSTILHRILFSAFASVLFVSSFWDIRAYLLRRTSRHWIFWVLADYSKALGVTGIFIISTVWTGLDFADYSHCHDVARDCMGLTYGEPGRGLCQAVKVMENCRNPMAAWKDPWSENIWTF